MVDCGGGVAVFGGLPVLVLAGSPTVALEERAVQRMPGSL